VEPRKSALSRPVAMRLAAVEYDRCAETFRSLTPAQWAMPTDCPAWDVRQLAAHMLGMAEMAASIRENLRQQRKAAQAAKAGALYIDALTQLQVDERADWTPARITERYAARAPKASAGRRRTPAFVRSRTMPQSQEVNGVTEPWTLGYLIDVILTRDPWMHRMDIAAATGTAPPRYLAGRSQRPGLDPGRHRLLPGHFPAPGQPRARRAHEHRGPVLEGRRRTSTRSRPSQKMRLSVPCRAAWSRSPVRTALAPVTSIRKSPNS
jgi:uncharacterized protein (TIGR03083 family)